MSLPWNTNGERNYSCVGKPIVTDIISERLRTVFRQEWNNRYQATLGAWDNTATSGQMLFNMENKRPSARNCLDKYKKGNINEWDCTVLFDAILYSNSIGKAGLNPTIKAEVDNLRKLRNEVIHVPKGQLLELEFEDKSEKARKSFLALGLPIKEIDDIKTEIKRVTFFQVLLRLLQVSTIKLTYFCISGNSSSGKSHLARQIAMASHESLSLEIVINYMLLAVKVQDREQVGRKIRNSSLILSDECQNPSIRLYRVVHDAIKSYVKERNMDDTVSSFDFAVMSFYQFKQRYDERNLVPHLKAFLTAMEEMFPKCNTLYPYNASTKIWKSFSYFGSLLYHYGEFRNSKRFQTAAHVISEEQDEPNPIQTAVCYQRLSNVHVGLGDLQQAKQYCERALDITIKQLGPDHIHVASTYNNLCIVHEAIIEQFVPTEECVKLVKTDSRRAVVKNKAGVNVCTVNGQCERKFLVCSDGLDEVESTASQENKTKSDVVFMETIHDLEKKVKELEIENLNLKEDVQKFNLTSEKFREETDALQNKLKESNEELRNVLEEFGRFIFENEQKAIEKKRKETFEKLLKSNVVNVCSPTAEPTLLSQDDGASTSTASIQSPDEEVSENVDIKSAVAVVEEITENDEVREESNNAETISLTYVPSTAVERSIYNNYKLLLLMISDMLLSNEVVKFNEWARDVFHVDIPSYLFEGLLELDRKGVISASDLTYLRSFFEELQRFDVVHLIDCFLHGDYIYLQRSVSSRKINNPNRNTRTAGLVATTSIANRKRPPAVGLLGGARNSGNSEGVEVKESFTVRPAEVQNSQFTSRSTLGNCRTQNIEGAFGNNINRAGLVATDGVVHNKYDRAPVSQSEVSGRQPSQSSSTQRRVPQVDMGSNGNKLSKFAREDSSRNRNPSPQDSDDDDCDVQDEKWLCNHYKRRCHVKFACCDKYWPCHRCHNNESNCGAKKLKSIHTKFVKCAKCGKEQEFGDGSQYCTRCQTKFASYFCAICKHLTGKDNKPYHCDKCGICRIHKHRSFHCDVCGVCLDVQLRDNHKCRAGSAHDECCICLEDVFTGCQILPCSHKVHKECASQMIRNGITRCPICRESFAHKLEKRQSNPPRKHHSNGKNPFQT